MKTNYISDDVNVNFYTTSHEWSLKSMLWHHYKQIVTFFHRFWSPNENSSKPSRLFVGARNSARPTPTRLWFAKPEPVSSPRRSTWSKCWLKSWERINLFRFDFHHLKISKHKKIQEMLYYFYYFPQKVRKSTQMQFNTKRVAMLGYFQFCISKCKTYNKKFEN